MIEGPIDVASDGSANQARLTAIRDAVASNYQAAYPFLLLPVRIETRFVKVDVARTGAATDAGALAASIDAVRSRLAAVAERPLRTELGASPRRATVSVEKAHYATLDRELDGLATVERELADAVRNVSVGGEAGIAILERAATELQKTALAATANVQTLRSSFQGAHYRARFEALQDAVIAPLVDAVRRVAIPTLRLLAALPRTPATALRDQLQALRVQAAAAARSGHGDEEIAARLVALQRSTQALVAGTPEELAAVRTEWTGLDGALQSLAGRLPADAKLRAAIIAFRADLAGLGSARVATHGELGRAAHATDVIEALLAETLADLEQEPASAARSMAQAMEIAARVDARARRLAASAREIAIAAPDRRRSLVTAHGRVITALAPWTARLTRLAEHGGAAGRAAADALAGLRTALTQQERAIAAIAEQTLLAIDAAPTSGVDELWVRVYPDDLAVHSHEEALTDSEVQSGREFWLDTIAAGDADARRRSAWRGLVQRHGARRAAYIASVMTPLSTRPPAAGAAAFLAALRTLDRRLEEITSFSGWFLRDPEQRLGRGAAAADAVIATMTSAAPSAAELDEARGLLRVIESRIAELASRLDRRARFLADAASAHTAFEQLTRRIETIAQGVAGMTAAPAEDAAALTFSDVPRKDHPWSVAPHCRVLPEQFVALTVRGQRVTHAVAGERIESLQVGPDPGGDASAGFIPTGGELTVGAGMRWMTDFDEAVARGMAVRITLTPEEARDGFDELLVLGVRTGNAADGQRAVEELLTNHHYNEQGLAFVAIGTPTNNTEEEASGYRSDDDADRTFDVERIGADLATAPMPDGRRFAAALGIRTGVVERVAGADRLDVSRAVTGNRALWPATLGAFADEMLGGVMSADTARRLERFFADHVTARGVVPAIRVGAQPYGVLATTAFSRFTSALGTVLPPMPGGPDALTDEAERARRFDILLIELLARARADWSRVRAAKVKHAHSDPGGEPQAHFLEMLGLEATGVTAAYRYTLNVANRHPAPTTDEGLGFGISSRGPLGLLEHLRGFFEHAFGLPASSLIDGTGHVAATWKPLYERLAGQRAYDVRVLDGTAVLGGALVGEGAAYLAELLGARPMDLVRAGIRDDAGPHPLLYLLGRQAILVRLRTAALAIAEVEGLLTGAARRAIDTGDTFVVRNLLSDEHLTRWSYLFSPLDRLDGRLGVDFPIGIGTLHTYLTQGPARSLADYLAGRGDNPLYAGFTGPHKAKHDVERAALQAHAADLASLAGVPAAEVERLVREHLDLVSHRLDAWQLGLANRRLSEMRTLAPAGVYLGAFGWVEDLRPGGQRRLAEDLPASLEAAGVPIYTDADDQGFIHAPSLTHAVMAAILRSGYMTEHERGDPGQRLAVNLSSRRVRAALELLEGIQAGHDLGALLGYRFERELHEAYTAELGFDDLIPGFRRGFPGAGAVDPASAAPERASRLVTDGLSLLGTVRAWFDANVVIAARRDRTPFELLYDEGRYAGYPWDLVDVDGARILPRLPSESANDGQRLPVVLRAIDHLADAVDAIGDLALAEGVYQIVRGNFPRAAAVLAAIAEGRTIPRPQVVDTPRTGTAVAHRIVLPLRRFDGRALTPAAMPPGWTSLPITPRAAAEPGVNYWTGELLGRPEDIVCRYLDPAGDGVLRTVDVAALGLQPIDLLSMIGPGLEDAEAELVARITLHALPVELDLASALAAGPRAPIAVQLVERDPGWDSARKTPFEIAALLTAAHDLLAKARPANADDLAAGEGVVAAGASSAPAIDTGELDARVTAILARARDVALALMTVLNGGEAPAEDPALVDAAAYAGSRRATIGDDASVVARYRELAALALTAADLGVRVALPPARFESIAQTAAGLFAAVSNAFVQLAGRLARAQTRTGVEAARELLGPRFPIVPHFTPRDADLLRAQLDADELLRHAGPFAVDAFLDGAAAVRESLRSYAHVAVLGDAFGAAMPAPRPAQLPAFPGDYWLGASYPPEHQPASDKLSLVVLAPAAWELGASPVAALLVDQWTDVIPNQVETTGVAFFYDQPAAVPPQVVLLAVPPRPATSWSWDDLVHTLHDTLELARNRTVELHHLSDEIYGQLLPAAVGEVVPDRLTGAPVTGERVVLDFGANNQA